MAIVEYAYQYSDPPLTFWSPLVTGVVWLRASCILEYVFKRLYYINVIFRGIIRVPKKLQYESRPIE